MKKKSSKIQRFSIALLFIMILGLTHLAFLQINKTHKQTTDIHNLLSSKNKGLSEKALFNLSKVIVEESKKNNMDPSLVVAIISVESSFKHKARSRVGALGLMQIRPFVAEPVAKELGIKWEGAKTLYDPIANVKIGIYYFAKLNGHFKQNLNHSLAAYNYGPTAIRRFIRHGKKLPTRYSTKVLAAFQELV